APHAHLVRYAGLFAPAAKWRSAIVPAAAAAAVPSSVQGESVTVNLETIAHREDSLANVIDATMPVAEPSSVAPHPRNYAWAELMKRVWALDVLECPRCRGRMRILADIHSPDAIERILKCLDLPRVLHQPHANFLCPPGHLERSRKQRTWNPCARVYVLNPCAARVLTTAPGSKHTLRS